MPQSRALLQAQLSPFHPYSEQLSPTSEVIKIPNDPADAEFFINALPQIQRLKRFLPDGRDSRPGEDCYSLTLRDELLKAAIKKNGRKWDQSADNLLFPPSVIEKKLGRDKVRAILTCECTLCASVKGRELLSDNSLVDAVTAKKGDEQRKLFALLVFMGAGFAVRHICSYNTRGWDIEHHQTTIQSQLFEPLVRITENIFPNPAQVTKDFISIYKQMWLLFDSPTMHIGNVKTKYDGANLPFIDRVLKADRSAFGSIYCFEIHAEFRGDKVPALAVRKELPLNDSTAEERQILGFLTRCGKPNFVQLLFWYEYGDKINYVFPKYPGSLYQLLEGELDDQISLPRPSKYRNILQHCLWQGVVDIIAALKFFHNPGAEQDVVPLDVNVIAAHFDLKPANILVTANGVLLLTDFGQARIKRPNPLGGSSLTAQSGDENYRPPPIPSPPFRKPDPSSTLTGSPPDPTQDIGLKWTRSYDVWSMACIMTEVIEYIMHGSAGFEKFRQERFEEGRLSAAFWTKHDNGGYGLKTAVELVLCKFEETQDRYLIMVTNLLRTMFSIDPLQRPTISDCLSILSEDFPTDDWPLKEEDEVSIAGLGTFPQLRNMYTQYVRKLENPETPRRCKMYLLLSKNSNRIRVIIEFKKKIVEGEKRSEINCIFSDSGRREEEEFKLLSLFDADYTPNIGLKYKCSFRISHHNLYFVFDEPQLGPDDYYYFFTAVTRQRSLRPQVHMSISNCTVRQAKWTKQKVFYKEGHVQIWRELTEDEYMREFTFNPPGRKVSDVIPIHPAVSQRTPSHASVIPQTSQSHRSMSTSSSSSGPTARPKSELKTRRIAIFLTGVGQRGAPEDCARLLTINITNGCNVVQFHRTGEGHKSQHHVSFQAGKGADFNIGNFPSQKDCPGIPLDPETLADHENYHVDWVDLEFKNPYAIDGFKALWKELYPNDLI